MKSDAEIADIIHRCYIQWRSVFHWELQKGIAARVPKGLRAKREYRTPDGNLDVCWLDHQNRPVAVFELESKINQHSFRKLLAIEAQRYYVYYGIEKIDDTVLQKYDPNLTISVIMLPNPCPPHSYDTNILRR